MNLFNIDRRAYYAGPPVSNSLKQPKQREYELTLFGITKSFRGKVVYAWEQGYDNVEVQKNYLQLELEKLGIVHNLPKIKQILQKDGWIAPDYLK